MTPAPKHIRPDRIAGGAVVAASAPRLYGSSVIRMDAVNPEGANQP